MKWWGYLIAVLIKTLFAVVLAFLLVAVDNVAVWSASYIIGAVYIALLGDVGADITGTVVSAVRKKPAASTVHAAAGFVLTLCFIGDFRLDSPSAHGRTLQL
ncbi:MAG: hypothetical protein IK093_02365 [Ruminiclostridium sp.]|nr:hypothetical protein [Ruminiclostridium sp.]